MRCPFLGVACRISNEDLNLLARFAKAVDLNLLMQMKRLTRWGLWPVTIVMLSINVAVAAAASVGNLSVINEKGEQVSIEKSSVSLTPIYKQELFAELKSKEASHHSIKLQYDECRKNINEFYCWKMYGNEVSATKQKVPGSMLQIAFDPLYVVVAYKTVITNSIKQRKFGEDTLVVCLNPNVPSGYWKVINQYKPILKSTPNTTNPQPLDKLKSKACKQLVRFKK